MRSGNFQYILANWVSSRYSFSFSFLLFIATQWFIFFCRYSHDNRNDCLNAMMFFKKVQFSFPLLYTRDTRCFCQRLLDFLAFLSSIEIPFLLSCHSVFAIIHLDCIISNGEKTITKKLKIRKLIISFSFFQEKTWYFCTKIILPETSHDFTKSWSKRLETDTALYISWNLCHYLQKLSSSIPITSWKISFFFILLLNKTKCNFFRAQFDSLFCTKKHSTIMIGCWQLFFNKNSFESNIFHIHL